MYRLLVSLSFVALLLWSCGPDSRSCSGPNFKVVLKLMAGPLPLDTVVRVTYAGSAIENFRLSDQRAPKKVAFCWAADENGLRLDLPDEQRTGAAGAAGSSTDPAEPQIVHAIYCDLWTGGFTELSVTGSGFDPVKHDLAPQDGLCTVEEPPIVLDSPDAG